MKGHLILSTIVGLSCLCAPSAVLAEEEFASDEQPAKYRPVTSIEAMTRGSRSAQAFARAAEYCLHNEQYDQAIKLSKMALDRNDDDNEIHQVYAEALEGKLRGQVERDPMIFNQCVTEWLIVLRQQKGDEKLANSHGIGIPGLGRLYEDEDRVIPARMHLLKLTGRIPKVLESNTKYLQKVLMPTTETVTGKVLKKHAAETSPKDEK